MELLAAERIFQALNRGGVQYLVVGGFAVNAYGIARLTMDIDLVIGLRRENILRGLQSLAQAGFGPALPITPAEFADPANRQRWRDEKGMRVLKMWSAQFSLTPLGIFVYEPFDFAAEYAAAPRVKLGEGLDVPIVRLPTLLAMKREAGRPQDLADIQAIEQLEADEQQE